MWAIAHYDFGLSDEEFGDLTPALFEALLDRKVAAEKKEFLQTGILAAAIINYAGRIHEGQPVNPLAFVPNHEEKVDDISKLPPDQQAAAVMKQMFKREVKRG